MNYPGNVLSFLWSIIQVWLLFVATVKAEFVDERIIDSAIATIRDSCVLGNDYGFLKRVAVAEARYAGTQQFRNDAPTGIWHINPEIVNAALAKKSGEVGSIDRIFNVKLSTMGLSGESNYRIPFFGAIAAWLQALHCNEANPIPMPIEAQVKLYARCWNRTQMFFPVSLPNSKCAADILFIIDSSGSNLRRNFSLITQFISRTSKEFELKENSVRLAVLSFADDVREDVTFNEGSNIFTFLEKVAKMRFMNGHYSETMEPLMYAHNTSFPNGGRNPSQGIPRIAILIGDSHPTYRSVYLNKDDELTTSRDPDGKQTLLEARKLKDKGVTLFAVAVQSSLAYDFSYKAASDPACMRSFKFETFNDMSDILPSHIRALACDAPFIVSASQNQVISNYLEKGASASFNFSVDPNINSTIKICLSHGAVSVKAIWSGRPYWSPQADYQKDICARDDNPTMNNYVCWDLQLRTSDMLNVKIQIYELLLKLTGNSEISQFSIEYLPGKNYASDLGM